MTDKPKTRIVVDEDIDIVARLDEIAEHEGLSRADILRRAIRRMLFSLPSVPANENFQQEPEQPTGFSGGPMFGPGYLRDRNATRKAR